MIDRDTEWWVRTYRCVAWWCRLLAFVSAGVYWYRSDGPELVLMGWVSFFAALWVGASLEKRSLRGELEIIRDEEVGET